jgi:hypothetical protein
VAMTPQDIAEFRAQLEAAGETRVRENLELGLYGHPGTERLARAQAWVKERALEEEASHRKAVEDLAREANNHAREANDIAEKARTWSRVAAWAALPAAVASLLALLKSFGVI